MKKYFYSDGIEKHGPVSLDDLKHKNITNDTLIWFQGLNEWTPAKNLDEMRPILELIPPPITILEKEPEVVEQEDIPIEEEKPENPEIPEKQDKSAPINNKEMFSRPFSFEGRIRRTEFGVSFIIYLIAISFVNFVVDSGEAPLIGFAYIPLLWFLWAQGAKRCHDRGNSGWFQIIPFYVLWMLFAEGEQETNEYGTNPKA
jgi:uncharacterized membrane protein YhaH (DUF805 family)